MLFFFFKRLKIYFQSVINFVRGFVRAIYVTGNISFRTPSWIVFKESFFRYLILLRCQPCSKRKGFFEFFFYRRFVRALSYLYGNRFRKFPPFLYLIYIFDGDAIFCKKRRNFPQRDPVTKSNHFFFVSLTFSCSMDDCVRKWTHWKLELEKAPKQK